MALLPESARKLASMCLKPMEKINEGNLASSIFSMVFKHMRHLSLSSGLLELASTPYITCRAAMLNNSRYLSERVQNKNIM